MHGDADTRLVIRAQTLALHAEGVAAAVGSDGNPDEPIELRVQIMSDGTPAFDEASEAGSSSEQDGSPWAPLSKERTIKFV